MRLGIVIATGLLTSAAIAEEQLGSFDGIYRQVAGADCARIGEEGGALKVEDNTFIGVGSQCTMISPVSVRDMNAVLYDMECEGEDTHWVERVLFMKAADAGLIMVWNGYAFKYDNCSEEDLAASVGDGTVSSE